MSYCRAIRAGEELKEMLGSNNSFNPQTQKLI